MNDQPNPEQWLDDIMEDLIIGHNFDYARKAILEHLRTETDNLLDQIALVIATDAIIDKHTHRILNATDLAQEVLEIVSKGCGFARI